MVNLDATFVTAFLQIIVEMSNYPVSIVIIGVGNSDFKDSKIHPLLESWSYIEETFFSQ